MKLGALDIGTNTVLMLVAERREDGRVVQLDDFERITRIGRGVEKAGRLDANSRRLTMEAIAEFARRARFLGADKIVGVATAALRDAADGQDFVDEARVRAGVNLEIISGDAEACLSYLAVKRGLPQDRSARLLVVDIGGGSTEFIRTEPGREISTASLPIGSVRLTERHIRHDPPTPDEMADILTEIDSSIDSLDWRFRPDVLVGVAGTAATVCAAALNLSVSLRQVHGRHVAYGEVNRMLEVFRSMRLEERRKLPGVAHGRADVIIAGTAILDRVMKRFGVEEFIVSDQGVRWGLAWREFERSADGSQGVLAFRGQRQ